MSDFRILLENAAGLNPLLIFLAAMSTYVTSGVWYSPGLFGKIWHRESRDKIPFSPTHPLKVLAIGIVFSLIIVTAFALSLGPHPTVRSGTLMGLDVGFCFAAANFGLRYQFMNLSLKLWLIDGGFRVLQFAVFGLLLGALGVNVNYAAVLTAAVAGLILESFGIPRFLFGKIWSRLDAGRQQLRTGQPLRTFGGGLVFSLIAAAAFGQWLGPHPSLSHALFQGLWIGLFFVATGLALYNLFAHHKMKMALIDGGYHVAQFLVFGLVLGWWG